MEHTALRRMMKKQDTRGEYSLRLQVHLLRVHAVIHMSSSLNQSRFQGPQNSTAPLQE